MSNTWDYNLTKVVSRKQRNLVVVGGVVKHEGLHADLHKYSLEKNLHKMKKLLKKGVDVDCVNHLGQSPLFCASLLGLTNVTELLLHYGADPNHRCVDRSTPVHAAVFSCNPWLLSGLLDAGGDLRLHDYKGRIPQDWAEAGGQEHSARMLQFLNRCERYMHSLFQRPQSREMPQLPMSNSSKTLLRSPSLLDLLKSGGYDRKMTKSPACDSAQCVGFGKLCKGKPGQALGLLASLPLIGDSELWQAEDEPLHCFSCGSIFSMTNYSWKGCRVTVKELQLLSSPQEGSQESYLDLLLSELEYCRQLFHPHLLQLMAVSMSGDLLRVRLVFERVHLGSLHSLLHHRRVEFPLLDAEAMLTVVLQVCEALLYLHGRALVLRALSSHSVLLTHPGVAKLSSLGFMVPSDGSSKPLAHLPLPPDLYNWAAPEVIRGRPCTGKADLYSLCTLIQELYTDSVPWGPVDPGCIRQTVESGQVLCADSRVPQPYYTLVTVGLNPRPKDRTHSLQDLRYTLRKDIEELAQIRRRRRSWQYADTGLRPAGWGLELGRTNPPDEGLPYAEPQDGPSGQCPNSAMERQIQDHLRQLDNLLARETEEEGSGERGVSTDSDQPSLHITFRDILPLDEWRLSPAGPLDPYCTQDEESASSILTDEEDKESEMMKGTVQPDRPASSRLSDHISSTVLNLKVSQVLLQQCECSLSAGEASRHRRQRGPVDEVDAGPKRCEAQGPHVCSSATSLSSTMSEPASSMVSRAVGPPSQYRLLPYGVHPSAKRLEAQVLKGGEAWPLSAEELAVWQSEYPAKLYPDLQCTSQVCTSVEYPTVECTTSEETSSECEEVSQYSLAQDDSFVTMRRRRQQAGGGQGYKDPRAGGQQAGTQPPVKSLHHSSDSPCVCSEGTDSLEDSPPPPDKDKWTTNVSELVARMTRGRLGLVLGHPGDSHSEGGEDRRGQCVGPAVGPARQHNVCRSSPDPSAALQQQQSDADLAESSSELEQIFKSFAGIPSESEEDADFHSVNRTFNMTCGMWAGQQEEEGTCGSDFTQSAVQSSSMFYTPIPEQNNPSRHSQSPVSSEEHLDVTVEVCVPATNRAAPGEQTIKAKQTECQPVREESEVIEMNPPVIQNISFPLTRYEQDGVPDLDDVSSITCSPSLHQERWPTGPGSGRPPPCNSTPRSPETVSNFRATGVTGEAIPPLPSLLDTSPWSSTRSQLSHMESFATASRGAYSTVLTDHSSMSSVLQSPLFGERSLKETDMPTGLSELMAAKERATTGGFQEGLGSTCTTPTSTQDNEDGEERGSDCFVEVEFDYPEEERGVLLAELMEEEMEKERAPGGCEEGAVHLMEASSSVLEGGEKLVSEEEEGFEKELPGNREDSAASTEQTEALGACRVSTHRKDDRSEAQGAASGLQNCAKEICEVPDTLEDTDRAQSSLDEVLQTMWMGRNNSHRDLRSSGLVAHPTQPCSEDERCSEGDNVMATEPKRIDPNEDTMSVAVRAGAC
ncbi:hypothetical protein UPYG_G00122530 [Umbra pygmaea]|uniref:Protein kinase domain-containing protein n=1 Tax=Umbra pygmaea TaxID=75934 RepID=A0ABD0XMM5_UMBPY